MSALTPNLPQIQSEVARFAQKCRADEVVLFESGTLLNLCHTTKRHHTDPHRFEKISNIIKQLRLTTRRFDAVPSSLTLVLEDGVGITMDVLTPDTSIWVIISQATAPRMLEIAAEIAALRPVFAAIDEAPIGIDPHML